MYVTRERLRLFLIIYRLCGHEMEIIGIRLGQRRMRTVHTEDWRGMHIFSAERENQLNNFKYART